MEPKRSRIIAVSGVLSIAITSATGVKGLGALMTLVAATAALALIGEFLLKVVATPTITRSKANSGIALSTKTPIAH